MKESISNRDYVPKNTKKRLLSEPRDINITKSEQKERLKASGARDIVYSGRTKMFRFR